VKPNLRIAFAAAVVLRGLSTGVAAAPIDLSSGSAGFMSTPGSGGFSDSYTFSLVSTTTVNVLLSSVVGGDQDVDFTSLTLTGPSGVFTAGAFTADTFEN